MLSSPESISGSFFVFVSAAALVISNNDGDSCCCIIDGRIPLFTGALVSLCASTTDKPKDDVFCTSSSASVSAAEARMGPLVIMVMVRDSISRIATSRACKI